MYASDAPETSDPDEAILLADRVVSLTAGPNATLGESSTVDLPHPRDRVVCMTDGPEAEVGDIISVSLSRPRERQAVLEPPDYYPLRERHITFLEVHAHKKQHAAPAEPPAPTAEPLMDHQSFATPAPEPRSTSLMAVVK